MKHLILVRHAKSDWGDPAMGDHERPLNERGRRNAPEMGARLARRGINPDAVYSSTAVRAMATAEIVAGAVGFPAGEIVADRRLYHAGVETWLQTIAGLEDKFSCVMCFGHNPGLTELGYHVFGSKIENVPTCGVLSLEFETTYWGEAVGMKPAVVDFDCPKRKPVD